MSESLDLQDWRALKTPGFMETIGPLLAKRDGAKWRYGLMSGPQHANALGLIHGGVLTTLLDHAMSLVAWTAADRQPMVTAQMNVAFLGAARPGDFLEVDVALRQKTGSMVFMDASIRAAGREIASGSSVMKIRTKRPVEDRDGE